MEPINEFSLLDKFDDKYDRDKTYMVTSIGITTEELESCDNYTKMFIYYATEIVVYIPVSKTEMDTIAGAKAKLDELLTKEHISGSLTFDEKREADLCRGALGNGKIVSKNGKFYREITYTPYLNNLYFNAELKPNAGADTNGNRITVDPDKKKWVYKTWVFTNVSEKTHTIHFMDRTNRPGLVEYKNTKDITFAALNIPRKAEGVFIIKDSVLARPNFKDVGLQKTTGNPFRSLSSLRKLRTSIAGANAIYSGGNDTLYYNQLFSPVLRPNAVDANSAYLYIENSPYKDTYISVTDDPASSPIVKSRFVKDCYNNGLPVAFESANLFEGGIDSKYLMDIMDRGDKQDQIAIKRWRSIVKSHYDNHNMVITLNDDVNINPRRYDWFLRHYVGRVSNYVIKDPDSREEISAATPYEHNSEPYLDISEGFVNLPRNEHWKLSASPHLYSDIIRMEEQLSGQTYNHGKIIDSKDIVRGIKETRQDIFNHNGYTNGISFEDIIFIPIEKIRENGGEYYDEESDLVIILDDVKGSESVLHPFSKKRRELDQRKAAFEVNNMGAGCSIKIISNSKQEIGKVYYAKFLNRIYNIVVEDSYGQNSQIIVTTRNTSKGLPEINVYPLTVENLSMLNIFDNNNDAECLGLRKENLEKEGYATKLVEIEADREITKMNLEKAKVEFQNYLKKISTDLAAKKMEYELKFEEMISKSIVDDKANEYKLNKEKYTTATTFIKSALDAFNTTIRFIDIVTSIMKAG